MKKTVLITGASSGIGNATAKTFAERGWNVVATMRDPAAGAELAAIDDVLVEQLDVRDGWEIEQAIQAGIDRFGKIDALINNAGYSLAGVFESIPPEKIREQFEVNVFGMMDVTREILPHFRANKSGTIVNVSSRAGLVGLPTISLYAATKFALEGFSESLSYELASQNIVVKIVEPSGGVTGTNFSARMAGEFGPQIEDYSEFLERVGVVFAGLQSTRKTGAQEVAQVIFDAATDGSTQLRYFVGEDAGGFAKAKREMSDEAFGAFMRSSF